MEDFLGLEVDKEQKLKNKAKQESGIRAALWERLGVNLRDVKLKVFPKSKLNLFQNRKLVWCLYSFCPKAVLAPCLSPK